MSGMKVCDTGFIKRNVMYSGVRVGGWVAYDNYREEDSVRTLNKAKQLLTRYREVG